VLEDWHSFGPDYDPTLMAWYRNFTGNWDKIRGHYDERFFRMWTYYLLSCAGSFRSRRSQLWQIVFSRDGLREGYHRFRQWGCDACRPPAIEKLLQQQLEKTSLGTALNAITTLKSEPLGGDKPLGALITEGQADQGGL
jgi:hypothetical protein